MAAGTTPAHRASWSGLAGHSEQATVGILGVPFDNAASFRRGAAAAPAKIREITPHIAPVTETGQLLKGLRICDYGDVAPDLNWERYFATVTTRALETLQHPFALFLGGDHSVTIPLVKAFSRHQPPGTLGVLHLDAHTDLMDTFEGHQWSHACTARRVLENPNIDPRHLVFVGIRSWLEAELDFLSEHQEIGVYSAREVFLQGIPKIAAAVVDQLQGVDALYLTLDIDCLDPAYAPGTGTPEAGGLSTRDLLEFLRVIFAQLPVRALDIVEVSPPLDHQDMTSLAAIKVIYETFGWVLDK
jgi:agmatinase